MLRCSLLLLFTFGGELSRHVPNPQPQTPTCADEWSNYWSNEGTQPDDYSLADPTTTLDIQEMP